MDRGAPGAAGAGVPIVGRAAELGALKGFVGAEAPARSLVLTGEPGIGKTTLWEVGVGLARERGVRVLLARGGGAEAKLSFSGLADLLDGVEAEVLAGVPGPQRRALEVALRRAEPGGVPPEPFAIAAGLLSVLRGLAVREPVVIAVDDLHWLDSASADVLCFAARRVVGQGVSSLLSRRSGRATGLERVLEPVGLESLEVGALSFGASRRLLAERLGLTVPRRVLRRLFEMSAGNPLFVLELGRMLVERGTVEIGAELPVPDVLDDLFGARVLGVSEPVRRVLTAVALSAGLSQSQLAALAGPLAVEDAVSAGLLIVDGAGVRVSHPLLGAAAMRHSSAGERRELHLDLARTVGDQTLRARHLASATVTPDAELADTVAAAVATAVERGAVRDAVGLAEHALRLTPRGDAQYSDRVLALGECLLIAGELPRVTELLTPWIDRLPAGRPRARAHLLLGEAADRHEDHLDRALEQSEDDAALRATALATKATLLALTWVERIEVAEAWAQEALAAAQSAEAEVEQRALVALAWARVLRGRPIEDPRHPLPAAPKGSSLYESSIDRPAGVRLSFRGEVDQARGLFGRLLALAEERGEARSCAVLYIQLCELELRAGDARAAALLLEEWDEWTAMEETGPQRARCRALLAAVRGVPEEAAGEATAALAAVEGVSGCVWDSLEATRALGIAAMLEHAPERAVQSLRSVWEHTVREGVDDPGAFPVAPDLVEALVELGELEEALGVTARLRELAERQRHPWGLATAERCSAVVRLASESYDEHAAASLEQAAAAYGELGLRSDAARSLLLLGRAQRRFKQRAAARGSLDQAAAAFDQLGCDGWAEQTRGELARVSGRRAGSTGELTAAEQQVVELAAQGLSNREIAGRLFVSVYTVEAHLSHAYAKLGVSSRAQLAGRLAAPS